MATVHESLPVSFMPVTFGDEPSGVSSPKSLIEDVNISEERLKERKVRRARNTSRRKQRELNDRVIYAVNPNMKWTEEDRRGDALQVQWRSYFGQVQEDPQLQWKFEPFRDITEEEESRRLRQLCRKDRDERRRWGERGCGSMSEVSDSEGFSEFSGAEGLVETRRKTSSVRNRWARIDQQTRRALKRHVDFDIQFLVKMEKELLSFLQTSTSLGESPVLLLTLKDSYYRRLTHGMCRFYGLFSQSEDMDEGERIMCVRKSREVQTPNAQVTYPSIVQLVQTLRKRELMRQDSYYCRRSTK